MIEAKFVERIAQETGIKAEQAAAAIPLFDKGATVPFVARYRKDVTGNLNEDVLESIQERNAYFIALTNRRNAVLENIEKEGKMTDELRTAIGDVYDQTALEDLYLPFRKQRRTKASMARDQGLEPLADFVWDQRTDGPSLEEFANSFVDSSKSISSPEEALLGAQYILSERVAADPFARGLLRKEMLEKGALSTRSTKNAEEGKTKFEAYYAYTEALSKIPSHRLLAVLRGVRMGILRMDVLVEDEAVLEKLVSHYLKPDSIYHEAIRVVVEDAYRRLLRPAIENEVISLVRAQADDEAVKTFREGAEHLLLSPRAGSVAVLGVDPGTKSGCKLAVVRSTGEFAEEATICLEGPDKNEAAAEETVIALLERNGVHAIAVSNGAGLRDMANFFRKALEKHGRRNDFVAYVSEAGASVYSTSKLGREEFPDLDVGVRGAISIARRLQDPLAELVKIEPKSIGAGQYQHDVNQRRLREGLTRTVEYCVNRVGADLNTAPVELLRYVSAIQIGTAQNIVAFRNENGPFKNRRQLLEVSGIGEKTYEQCAGFLRICGGEQPLDATHIHPEAYPIIEKMAAQLGITVEALVGNHDALRKLDFDSFAAGEIGRWTLADIRQELFRPGRDPRHPFQAPRFLENVHSFEQVEPGMEMDGVVTNVTSFGAFVDIGVHQDGLIHLSELSRRFVNDPHKVVHPGDVIRVRVVKVDKASRRISLSHKAAVASMGDRPRPSVRPRPAAPSAEETAPAAARTQERTPRAYDGERPSRGRDADRTPRERDGARPPRRRDDNRPSRDQEQRKPAPRGNAKPKAPLAVSQPAVQEGLNTLLADQLAALKEKFGR